jgi:nitroimidazol reductase NimA-like FMN-containing flavoprotein (pyridoxamine 5'-phosphate oxidase superfamily)
MRGTMNRTRPTMPVAYGIPKDTKRLLKWEHVIERMTKASHYWVCTVDPKGQPHATPVDALWVDGALYFGGSAETRRHRNLAANPSVVVHLEDAMDVVILHGTARELRDVDRALAQRLAEASKQKYGWAPKPDDFAKGGTWVLRPRKVLAWKKFPKDVTRFRLDEDAPA